MTIARRILILALCCGIGVFALANDNPPPEQRLRAVGKALAKLEKAMAATRARYGKRHAALERHEQRIGEISENLEKLDQLLAIRQRSLEELRLSRDLQQQKLHAQQDELGRQIRSAYLVGRQDYLKILLNQEDPGSLGRVLTYYDYFNRAYSQRITAIRQSLERLRVLEQDIERETQEIRALQIQFTSQKQVLEQQVAGRREVLRELSRQWEDQQIRIAMLEEDKARLGELVQTMDHAFAEIPLPREPDRPFHRRKGHLPYPLQGEILNRYGAKRGLGALRWRGILIAANPGDPVRAVADGQVVFAGWLRNFGHLLIVEHDHQYMTLYGHNQRLLKTTGDPARQGETIAFAGNSGGQDQPALYFELRRQGKPLNPNPWLTQVTRVE